MLPTPSPLGQVQCTYTSTLSLELFLIPPGSLTCVPAVTCMYLTHYNTLKMVTCPRHQWLTPVILATWKADIGVLQFEVNLGKCLWDPTSKITKAKMDWRCGTSGRVTALEVWSLEFKPQCHQKKKKIFLIVYIACLSLSSWTMIPSQTWSHWHSFSLFLPAIRPFKHLHLPGTFSLVLSLLCLFKPYQILPLNLSSNFISSGKPSLISLPK
jgi:hypothetical protein